MGSLDRALELALRQREFEISQLTQRNNFFMIFQGVLIAGLIQSGGAAAPVISFAVCLIGVVTSWAQVCMAAGSKYWQMRWERASKTVEVWLLDELKDHPRVTQFFTADGKDLSAEEAAILLAANCHPARASDLLSQVRGAVKTETKKELIRREPTWLGKIIDLLILWKPSVSRIPIYIGIALFIFWTFLFTFTFSINGLTPGDLTPSWFSLTPMKSEAK
jgi:hypothetical protein